jgi:sugar lactone lactonase YvrE
MSVAMNRWGRWSGWAGQTLGAGVLVVMALLGAAGCSQHRIVAEPVYFPASPNVAHAVHLRSFTSFDELVAPKVSWVDALRGGFASSYVETPAGLAYHDGKLYVCDTALNLVHEWDLVTGVANELGGSGNLALMQRAAVVVLGQGAAHLLSPPGGAAFKPVAVAIEGSTLFAADIANHRIEMFSVPDGAHKGGFGGAGNEPGKLYFPMGVSGDGKGRLYVSDSFNGRVQGFDAATQQPQISMGQPGDRYGDMGKPRHVAVGPDGVVFVADTEFRHVHLFDAKGTLLMLLGGPDIPLGGTPMPVGVAIAPTLPPNLTSLVPANFDAQYFLFVSNTVGTQRMSLYAIGLGR